MSVLLGAQLNAQQQIWTETIGTTSGTDGRAVALDGLGGVFTLGSTILSLGGPHAGSADVYLARHDSGGNLTWIRQFGTADSEVPLAATPDGQGGLFAGGDTTGSFGGTHAGLADGWFGRFDAAGNVVWLRQLGSGDIDVCSGVAVDGQGGVFAAGDTLGSIGGPTAGGRDIWVARYDGAGNALWTRQFGGGSWELLYACASDGAGGVLLCGRTEGGLAPSNGSTNDAWIARYDGAGNQLWVKQFGVPNSFAPDSARGITSDGQGGLFVCGATSGDLAAPNAGYGDAWIARFDGSGSQLWMQQFGSVPNSSGLFSGDDLPLFCVRDGSTGVILGGSVTDGTFEGTPTVGKDTWFARYSAAGERLWVQQFSLGVSEFCAAAASSPSSGLFLGGNVTQMSGTLGWVARFDTSCGLSVPYCNASTTSIAGCQAVLQASGSPSLSAASAYSISSGPVPGGNIGICIFGANGAAAIPLGSLGGLLCVNPPFARTGPKLSGGTLGTCDGNYVFTLQDMLAVAPLAVEGGQLNVEIWARDPANADGYLLSSALRFQVCP